MLVKNSHLFLHLFIQINLLFEVHVFEAQKFISHPKMDNFAINKANLAIFEPIHILEHVLGKKLIELVFWYWKWNSEPVLKVKNLAVYCLNSFTKLRTNIMHSLLVLSKIKVLVQD